MNDKRILFYIALIALCCCIEGHQRSQDNDVAKNKGFQATEQHVAGEISVFPDIKAFNRSSSKKQFEPFRPANISIAGDNPSVVYLSIYVRSISSINTESMDYVVDLYLQQQWLDERLKNESQVKAINYNDRKVIQRVWKPDVIFTNSKESSFHYITLPNVLMRVEPNGSVLYILRLKVKFDCMMDFFKYPMDVQTCSMEISTFAKTNDELQLRWAADIPITLYKGLKLSQFRIASVRTYHCNITYYFGQFSCLKADFHLERELSYHLVQSYFSTSLIVVISWLSFWLNIDAIAARITLGVTTLLTISSKGVGIENKLPPVTYLKAIDVWIFVCTTFVFAALLEFTVANYVWRMESNRDRFSQQLVANNKLGWLMLNQKESSDKVKPSAMIASARSPVSVAENIDQRSRILFPVLFLLFAFLYWFYYCCWI